MFESLLNLDYQLFDLIHNDLSFHLGDQFFPLITDLHKNPISASILVLVVLTFLYWRFKKTCFKYFLAILVCLSAVDFTGSFVKNRIERKRPFETQIVKTTQKSPAGSKSFYSNHASNMTALATLAWFILPAQRFIFLFLALLIGYSRIYNGVHYPSDVLIGSLAGFLIASLQLQFMKKSKYFNEIHSKLHKPTESLK